MDAPAPAGDALHIAPLDPTRGDLIDRVALRMRLTLQEVLGEEAGRTLYTLEWLVDRVWFHLDPGRSRAAVLLAWAGEDRMVGHTIVRVETGEDGLPLGLFSTTYVDPAHRRQGVADRLLTSGEAWMRGQNLDRAATDTSATNGKLIALYRKHGYEIILARDGMVRLGRTFDPESEGFKPEGPGLKDGAGTTTDR